MLSYNDVNTVAERGEEIYARKVQPLVDSPDTFGKVVAIDVESEAFEVGEDIMAAGDMLRQRIPEPLIWYQRIGHRGLHRIGIASAGRS